mgnify:CR=1 FL=1
MSSFHILASGPSQWFRDGVSLSYSAVNAKISRLSKTASDKLNAKALPNSGPVIDALFKLYQDEVKQDRQLIREQLALKYAKESEERLDKRWHKNLYQQVSKVQVISITEFNQLAAKRANAVKVYLQNESKIAASRMFVLSHQKDVMNTQSQAQLTLVTK